MSKVLSKSLKRWGINIPFNKLAVRLTWQPDRLAVDRPGRPPTVRNMTVGEIRSTARSTSQIQRASSLVRSTGPVSARRAQSSAPRSTGTVDRPLVRSTARSTDLACQAQSGSENWVRKTDFYISKKSFISSKNPQK